MNAEYNADFGLRSSYRLKQTTEVVTKDFFGPNKGADSAAFIAATQGLVDYQMTQIIEREDGRTDIS
jgi:hypothetical protein